MRIILHIFSNDTIYMYALSLRDILIISYCLNLKYSFFKICCNNGIEVMYNCFFAIFTFGKLCCLQFYLLNKLNAKIQEFETNYLNMTKSYKNFIEFLYRFKSLI